MSMISRSSVLFVFAALFSPEIYACQCRGASVEVGLSASDLVFGAEVVGAKVKGELVEISIRNFVLLKGSGRPLSKVVTTYGRSSCVFPIVVPSKYVFFSNKSGMIDSCGATRRFDDQELGELTMQAVRMWDDLRR
jgi:hypothetical protein